VNTAGACFRKQKKFPLAFLLGRDSFGVTLWGKAGGENDDEDEHE